MELGELDLNLLLLFQRLMQERRVSPPRVADQVEGHEDDEGERDQRRPGMVGDRADEVRPVRDGPAEE